MSRVLVCGGRDFDKPGWLTLTMDTLHEGEPFTVVIEGGALGADRLARAWANARRVPVLTFEADWMAHGRGAGPRRNARMLYEGKPDLVVAFPGGRGTLNMIRQAEDRGVRVLKFEATAYSARM